MTPNASFASTSKGVRSSSRASGTSSMTRMDSLPRSTKDRTKWWDTTRRRLDMNGKILEEVYDRNAPYSEQIRIPFLFQGQYYDHETELAYNRFRYYSPELGRYMSEDPIRFASGTLALHNYVEDSNSWLDVLGLTYKSKKTGEDVNSSVTVFSRQKVAHNQVEIHVDSHGPHVHINRGTKKEQCINISGLTVGQAQEKLPKKVAQNSRVQDALKKALEY